ncbi:hypothetical protein EMIHUDRAFT_104010 [Emiliania huxleyi CCMP1516]|uniref:Rab3-GAP regulatory subunit N-terminal domain-containing protein n=2 Tax=Emiliania huxleyi TaxID=2903 RepID=A0A0D3INK4_EMIH1|nr:hypothetical protein EMIHUDRAFT_104010 [Emiliania huxleyi CCMP1516]EOD12839.1 hypothetical protein EMIHUDRAFT_104010 [Emiliania huxleyi CCMP1516]|eukprot:XP_005765268.1 hypothetical protein EMIHUDRAFT_104010 [Emiliania huxleyi CCMP1516]
MAAPASALAARMHALPRNELADLAELIARVCAVSTGADTRDELAFPSAHAETREHDDLVELTARMCHASADALSLANAALSEHVPPWAVEDVLLSPDLLPRIFATLELEDGAAAAACSAWLRCWIDTDEQRRGLRPAELGPLPPGFDLEHVSGLAAHPSGEMMAFTLRGNNAVIFVLDPSLQEVRQILSGPTCISFCFSENRLFACMSGARIISYSTDSFDEVARYTEEELDYEEYYDSVVGPNGMVHAVATYDDPDELDQEGVSEAIVAFDPMTLERRLHFGLGVFSKEIYGLAFIGDELYAGDRRGRSIRVFSLAGVHLREIKGDWREPCRLLHHSSRLYLSEQRGDGEEEEEEEEEEEASGEVEATWSEDRKAAGKRIFVLTPEGETLQVWKTDSDISGMYIFGRVLIAKVGAYMAGEFITLKGI